MENPRVQASLETERETTDASLDAERGKTNDSLTELRKETEEKTDIVVADQRQRTDGQTASLRSEADQTRVGPRDIDERLIRERKDTDEITERERVRIDAALAKERAEKRELMSRFLAQEREETDESLLVERARADVEVQDHSSLLSVEIAEHLKTKITLTSRDEFLAIVSHDLRNPIGSVSSCAEMLLEDPAYKMDPGVRTWIQFIKRSSDTALRLIGDLLDMEQVAEGKLKVKFGRHEIGRIIRDVIESHSQEASTKRILLRLMPAEVTGEINCDRDRITQVISNLIGNAIKFTPEGGSVTVNANFSASELQVSVRDTGPGVAEEMKEEIFERFVQISAHDRRGLGLGLYISKMLVEAHQGRLWVQSKVGEGSAFFFSLPR